MRILLVAALLAFLPTAHAALGMQLVGLDDYVMPETGTAQLTVNASLPCTEALPYLPTQATLPALVVFGVADPGVVITGPGSILLDVNGCLAPGTPAALGTGVYRVTASRDATSAHPIPVTVTLSIPGDGITTQPQSTAQTKEAKVAYAGVLKVKVAEKIVSVAPGSAAIVVLDVEAKANGPTLVTFSSVEAARDVAAPDPVILDATNGNRTTVTFLVQTADTFFWANDEIPIKLYAEAEPANPDLPGEATPSILSQDALVRERGAGLGLPIAFGLVVLAVVAGVFILVRRRKQA